MRFPSFPTIIRTFYTLSNYSARHSTQYKALQPFTRATIYKSMPTIPFLSSFFGTSTSNKMSYPLQKSDDEWQAVLSKGMSPRPFSPQKQANTTKSNSAFSARKEPKRRLPVNTTSTCPQKASTPAPPATPHSTKPLTSSSPDVDGLHISTISLAR
jgi:hypothetical protein